MTSKEYTNIQNWINYRHAPTLKRFHGYPIPQTFSVFDWVVWIPKDKNACRYDGKSPKSILCASEPRSIDWLLNKASFDSKPVLLIGGTDHKLSEFIEEINAHANRFKAIFFESKDIESEKIKSITMGFNASYIRACTDENILKAIEYSDNSKKLAKLFCAWGKIWPHLDKDLNDRIMADEFLKNHPKYKRIMVKNTQYWQMLAKHYFALCPAGNGIQAPKLAESWMVKTIPIVLKNPSFQDLYDCGYPLILLDSWEQINDTNMPKWLKYHRSIDWDLVRYKLTNQYLKKFIESF